MFEQDYHPFRITGTGYRPSSVDSFSFRLLQALIDQHLTNQQMAEPAVSSGSEIYETYLIQDSELRELAQVLWIDSQASKVSLGHATVADMMAIDMTLPLKQRVKQQEQPSATVKRSETAARKFGRPNSRQSCRQCQSLSSRRQCSWRSAGDLRTAADRRI